MAAMWHKFGCVHSARNGRSRAGHFNRQNAVYAEVGERVLPARSCQTGCINTDKMIRKSLQGGYWPTALPGVGPPDAAYSTNVDQLIVTT